MVVTDVNDAPTIDSFTPTADRTIAEPDSQAFTITASDPDGGTPSVKWYVNNKLSPEASAAYTFAGSYTSAGTYAIKAEVTDGQYTAQKTWTLTVTDTNRLPVLTAPSNATCTEDSLCTIAINATDPDTDNILVYSDNSPLFATGLLTGKVSFTPTQANVGSHSILFRVADGTAAVTRTTALTINNVNDAPVLATIGSRTLIEGGSYSIQASATDEDGDTLNYSLTNAPSGMKINSTTGLIKWSPTFQNSGTYNVLVKVSDGALSDSEDVVFTVLNANQAPTITSTSPAQSVTMKEDNATRFTLTASDPDGTALTTRWYKNSVLMAGEMGTSFTFQGIFTDEGTNAGAYAIKAEVTDGIATASYTWALTVTRTRDADKDTIPDYRDNCGLVYNPAQTDSDANGIGDACQGNIDGDDVADEEDFVAGSKENIETNVQNMELKISGSDDLNQVVTETQPVALTETKYDEATGQATTESVVEFEFNFASSTTLDLGELKIEKQTSEDAGSIVIKGLDLTSQGKTKSAFIDKLAGNDYVCIMDAEIASISELTSDCSGANEFSLKCDGVTREGYTCTDTGTKYKIEGLVHSGVQESSVADTDGDTVLDDTDNCITAVNPDQRDTDNDGTGDTCDIEACYADADCDSNSNDLTIGTCNNPGLATSSCSFTTIACNQPTDCGTAQIFTGTPSCSGLNVVQNFIQSYTCSNPGTLQASCQPNIQSNTFKQSCNDNSIFTADSCSAGVCSNVVLPIACSSDSQCNDNNALTTDTCQEPGLPTSFCQSIRCSTNAQCNDNNANTEDLCENPGTVSSACKNPTIACKTNADCGTDGFVTTNYCATLQSGQNVVNRDYKTFTCSNPGKGTASCTSTTKQQQLEACINGCTEGVCISNTKPMITSTPVTAAAEGAKYAYQVIATDAQQTTLWYSDNSPLFNINSLTGKIEFTPTKANAGAHQITITVSDGWLTDAQTYALTINPINGPPVLASIGALSSREGELFATTVTAADPEKAALTFSDNTGLFDINPSTGLISFTPAAADVGLHAVTITVSDGALTDSEALAFTVLAKGTVNTAPSVTAFTPENNLAITELQQQTFTVTAADKESTPGILWYVDGTVVGSGNSYTFIGDNSMENSNAGVYTVKAVASDGELKNEKTWTLTITRVKDTDGDEVADAADNCVFVANADQLDSDSNGIGNACQGNVDGDSVKDEEDFVDGTADVVDTNVQLSLTIAGEENLNKVITGTQPVTFTSTVVDAVTKEVKAEPIVSFQFEFTPETKLDLSKIEIKKQSPTATKGEVIVKGIDLSAQGKTKTVFMDKVATTSTVCIKDAEISSLKEINIGCDGSDEHLLTCDGVTRSGYTCTDTGDQYKIDGLKHSGVIESTPNSAPTAILSITPQAVLAGTTLQLSGFATDPDGETITDYEWNLGSYDRRDQAVMFVTKAAYAPGALGGLAGADAKCQAEADAAGLLGTYNAFLSATDTGSRCSSSKTAANRLNVFTEYHMVDGTLVGTLNTPQIVVSKDATGALVSGKALSFTGSDLCAVAADDEALVGTYTCRGSRDCDDWTATQSYVWNGDPKCITKQVPQVVPVQTLQTVPIGTVGLTKPIDISGYVTCSEAVHLYCVQNANIHDGGIIEQQSPSVKLTKPGIYTLTFTATDSRGGSDSESVQINVVKADIGAPANVNAVDKPGDNGGAVKVNFSLSADHVDVTEYRIYANAQNSPATAQLAKTVPKSSLTVLGNIGMVDVAANANEGSKYYWVQAAGSLSRVSALAGPNLAYPINNNRAIWEDLNSNGAVDVLDIAVVSQIFANSAEFDSSVDLNSDGTISVLDISRIAAVFGKTVQSVTMVGGQAKVVLADAVTDNDKDGYKSDVDCNDNNPLIHAVSTYYYDADGDGRGTSVSTSSCGPTGYYTATQSGDACDGAYGKLAPSTYYYDQDGDGRGTSASISICSPSGYYHATQSGDGCDSAPGIFTPITYYIDNDGDGYHSSTESSCSSLQKPTATKGADCDDANANIRPNGPECNAGCMLKDLNRDWKVDQGDIDVVANCFGQAATGACTKADLSQNGVIDILDISHIASCNGYSIPSSCVYEELDGQDNNCNGEKDEGLPKPVVQNLQNLALNKPASAISSYDYGFDGFGYDGWEFEALKAVDGNAGTRWASNRDFTGYASSSKPQWLTVDLGQSATIKKVELVLGPYSQDYQLQYSNDNQNWQTLTTYVSVSGTFSDSFTVNARYWRVSVIRSADSGQANVYEFRLFG